MKKERVLKNSLNVIRKFLKETGTITTSTDGPTNSVSSNKISGLTENPPVKLKNKNNTKPFKDLFRRNSSDQPKYPR